MDKIQINWQEYCKSLISFLSNEHIWVTGYTGYNPHIANIAELKAEIKSIDEGDYDTVFNMHRNPPEYFDNFILPKDASAYDLILIQKISERFHNLDYISLDNEFCILFQGLLTQLDFDYKRIRKEWDYAENDFSEWYRRLLPAERKRVIEYYTNKHNL